MEEEGSVSRRCYAEIVGRLMKFMRERFLCFCRNRVPNRGQDLHVLAPSSDEDFSGFVFLGGPPSD